MRLIALVPAGGGGSRFGGGIPKQYAELRGAPMLLRTLERLDAALALDRLYVAVAPDDARCREALAPLGGRAVVLSCGGSTRAATVRNALRAIAGACADDDWILVHDAARPCVPRDALQRLVAALRDDAVGGLLALPVADTLKRGSGPGADVRVVRTEDRNGLWQAQTPQMFRLGLLRRALDDESENVTDEAQAIERLAAAGGCAMPRLVEGSALNVKITYPADLALATAILMLQEQQR
jgi:2-C-methyl-D-erythritol 4-phosphate cytidylyltransferase